MEIKLPDIEEIENTLTELYKVSKELARLKLAIKVLESETVLKLHENNSKPPSMSFIQATYLVTGLDNALLEMRKKLIELETQQEYLKNKYELYKIVIEIWRTHSANERTKL